MALTYKEKRSLRRAFPDRLASNAIITILNSGSKAATTRKTERVIETSFGRKSKAANFIDALENGTASTETTKRLLSRAVGRRKPTVDTGLTTDIDAVA